LVKFDELLNMYDLIGDVHGHADELVELLECLDYRETNGVFRHRQRQAIFCGDFIDRGPRIRDVIRICRNMCEQDAALAVLGNHEFNALAWATPNPAQPGDFLRPHTDRNRRQHQATLEQLAPDDLTEAHNWFRQLPLSLDLDVLRVVHACWSPTDLITLSDAAARFGYLSPEYLARATRPGDPVFEAIEIVLKGPEMRLPDGRQLPDKEGHLRRNVRTRWFVDPAGQRFGTWTLPPASDPELSALPVPADAASRYYPAEAPPVFFGHYWLPDSLPRPLAGNVACLDYSVARGGLLAAYRFDGERSLIDEHFVSVRARRPAT
jgi:Calcineurin-like phosphoesterase